MTVREQITAFARARAIVAPHGAALANLVYAPRGAFVIEITSVDISHMADFRSIARSMGQHIVTITSDDYETVPARETPEMHRNYRVNVADVLTTLRREGPRLGDVG
jgi:capsular polysaccharide biosynthesis protein